MRRLRPEARGVLLARLDERDHALRLARTGLRWLPPTLRTPRVLDMLRGVARARGRVPGWFLRAFGLIPPRAVIMGSTVERLARAARIVAGLAALATGGPAVVRGDRSRRRRRMGPTRFQ